VSAAPSKWISNRQLNSLTAIAKPIYQHAHGHRTVRRISSKIKQGDGYRHARAWTVRLLLSSPLS
jgi:hypothetical protein